jgi:hypothetical protein
MDKHAEMVISVETQTPDGKSTYVEFNADSHAGGMDILRGVGEILTSVGFTQEKTKLLSGGRCRTFTKGKTKVEVGDVTFLVPDRR